MSHFYGTLNGSRGEATRCITWGSSGRALTLYHGPVNPSDSDIIGSTGEVVARLTAQALDAAD